MPIFLATDRHCVLLFGCIQVKSVSRDGRKVLISAPVFFCAISGHFFVRSTHQQIRATVQGLNALY